MKRLLFLVFITLGVVFTSCDDDDIVILTESTTIVLTNNTADSVTLVAGGLCQSVNNNTAFTLAPMGQTTMETTCDIGTVLTLRLSDDDATDIRYVDFSLSEGETNYINIETTTVWQTQW